MSGSVERSDNGAVPINFLTSEAQKQHLQKTFSSAAVKKNLQSFQSRGGRAAQQPLREKKGHPAVKCCDPGELNTFPGWILISVLVLKSTLVWRSSEGSVGFSTPPSPGLR